MSHGVIITELCQLTHDNTKIRNATNPVVAFDNGRPLTVGKLVEGERDLYTAALATESTTPDDIWIAITPELIYDESKTYTVADFYNGINDTATEKELITLGKLVKGDIFGVTIDILSEAPTTTKKYIAPSSASGKGWTVSSSATNAFAVYKDTTVNDGLTYYSFDVL